MANLTLPNARIPAEFLAVVEPAKRRSEGERLLELMSDVTSATPVMWGPTMIGFGTYAYRYPSGRKGEFFRVGFSPRKSALSLYGLKDDERAEAMLADLGPHTTGTVACTSRISMPWTRTCCAPWCCAAFGDRNCTRRSAPWALPG